MKIIFLNMVIAALLVTMHLFPVCAEASGAVIGYIDAYSGSADHYEIIRNNPEVPDCIGIWAELMEGDRIRVKQAGQTLTVQFTDGTRETFGPEAGKFDLVLKGKPSTVLGNLMTSLAGVFSDLQEGRVEDVAAHTRGEKPLTLDPIFSSGEAVLIEGRRNLYLSWRGGESPISVTINLEGSDTPVFQVDGIEARDYRVEQIDLIPGAYLAEIANAGGSMAFPLQVVAEEYRPNVPPSCMDAAISDELQAVTRTYCLASIDEGQWAFEAYQMLMPVADSGYPPVGLLLEGLRSREYRYWTLPEALVR